MVKTVKVEGFGDFVKSLEELRKSSNPLVILFSGSKGPDGNSWCPDCVHAEPVIENALKYAPEDLNFLYVGVGARDFWKDPNCIFRTDERTRLTCVPTLLRWENGPKERLLDDQCQNAELVGMIFE